MRLYIGEYYEISYLVPRLRAIVQVIDIEGGKIHVCFLKDNDKDSAVNWTGKTKMLYPTDFISIKHIPLTLLPLVMLKEW